MSVWAAKRQLFLLGGIFTVALVLVAIFAVSYFAEAPTCYDGKQNGAETGVDVGGNCPVVDSQVARNIVPLWSQPFAVTENIYSVVHYFENQNLAAGIENIRYRFRLYDADNIIIADRLGETFIGPNGRSAIFESGIDVGNRPPTLVFFEFMEAPKWLVTHPKFSSVELVVADQELTNTDSAPQLVATIENKTFETLHDIEIIAILYGDDGNAIATSKTFVSSIIQSGTEDIFFTWPTPFEKEVVRIEIIPRIDIFSERNK